MRTPTHPRAATAAKPPARAPLAVALAGCVLGALCSARAQADEGGVSFRLPGQFTSFAALPGHPAWALGAVYYHADVSAGAACRSGRLFG